MGKLHQIGNVVVRVWGKDHARLTSTSSGADFEAEVDIVTLEIIAGEIARNVRREVMEWAAANRSLLVAEWNRNNPNAPVQEERRCRSPCPASHHSRSSARRHWISDGSRSMVRRHAQP
jgi:hypothetical protein